MLIGGMSLRIHNWLAAAVEAGSTLLDGLVAYWPLDEQSGTRYDAVGNADLTDNNTVGASNAGPSGTVASFVAANSEYLSRAAVVPVDTNASFTVEFWYKPSINNAALVAQWDDAGQRKFLIAQGVTGNGVLDFYVTQLSTSSVNINVASALDTWHHCVAWYDVDASKSYLSVDNGTAAEGTITGGTETAGTSEFWVGRHQTDRPLTGYMGRLAVWSRVLTSNERTSLFNSGVGKSYSDLTTAEKVGLVSYWNLDEVSGVRADSHGDNDLTDNNTVLASNAGPVGTVASLVAANAESLSKASVVLPDQFSIGQWVYYNSTQTSTYPTFVACNSVLDWANDVQVTVYGAIGQFWFGAGDGTASVVANSSTAIPLDQWFYLLTTFDTDKKVRLYLNDTLIATTDALAGTPYRTAQSLVFGAGMGFDVADSELDGKMGSSGLWSRVLTSGERTSLFNSGVGKRYADLTTAEKVGLVSYWNLDETSTGVAPVTRVDSHGSNDLTDNNTTASVVNAGGAMHNAAASFVAANAESLTKTAFTLPTEVSVSGWLYMPNVDVLNVAVCSFDNQIGSWWQNQGLLVFVSSSSLLLRISEADGGYPTTDGHALNANAWNHFVATFDSNTGIGSLYLNNGTADTLTLDSPRIDPPFTLLLGLGVGTNAADMRLDEVTIWSRVLTEDERTALYAAGAGVYYPTFE